MKKQQIIALGGGGFSEEPDNPLLDLYVLDQAGVLTPKICFLPTASGDSESYLLKFYQFFARQNCRTSHLSLFNPHTAKIEDFILSQDIIYVGGGNTKSMLALWREWGLDRILKKAYDNGIVLAGVSAGAICWFEQGATSSIPEKISALPCLGFLPESCCPHFESEPLRQEAVPRMIKTGEMTSGYAIDNSVALHFIDGKISKAVASVKGRRAQYLNQDGDVTDLDVVYLGAKSF